MGQRKQAEKTIGKNYEVTGVAVTKKQRKEFGGKKD